MRGKQPLLMLVDWPDWEGAPPVVVSTRFLNLFERMIYWLRLKCGTLRRVRPTTRDEHITLTVGVEIDTKTYRLITGVECKDDDHASMILIPPVKEVEYDVENKIRL